MIYVILIIISIFLYINSPYEINRAVLICSFLVFLTGMFLTCKKDFKNRIYLSFNNVFLVSFFLVTYCVPLFVLGTENEESMLFLRFVDLKYATKATTLSTIAICFYFWGIHLTHRRDSTLKRKDQQKDISKFVHIAYRFSLVMVIINVFMTIMKYGIDTISLTENPFIYQIYEIVLVVSLLASIKGSMVGTFKSYVRDNLFVLFTSLCLAVYFLYIGDRGFAISILFIHLAVYSFFYSKLRIKYVFALGIIGVIMMFVIRETRVSGAALKNSDLQTFSQASKDAMSSHSFLYLFSDLYGVSQELYLGYEYKERYGLYFPEQIIIVPFMPIPMVPTIMSKFMFGKTPNEMSAGNVLNESLTTSTFTSFLGNHCVSDLYMRWGLFGVIVFFFLFGLVVSSIDKNKYNSLPIACCYVLIVADAIYLPRSSILDIYRPIVFTLFFIWIAYKVSPSSRLINEK